MPPNRKTTLLVGILVLAGVANNARSLNWGFIWDDYALQLLIRHPAPEHGIHPWSIYDFGGRLEPGHPFYDSGAFPWWTDADFKVRFFRPVTSVSIWLDYVVYGDWARGYHITSLLLFAVFLALAYRLFVNLGVPPAAALWALAFLGLHGAHCLPVGWISNRNELLAALLTTATLLLLDTWRRTRRAALLPAVGACFLLACGAKESGLAAFPIAVAYLFFFDRQERIRDRRAQLRRLLSNPALWTLTLLAAAFVLFYVSAGYGTRSNLYSAPWPDTAHYLTRLAVLLVAAPLSLFFGFATDILSASPESIPVVIAIGVPVLATTFWIVNRAVGDQPLARFAACWIFVALLPAAGGDISDRLLPTATIGSAILLGLFMQRIGSLRACWAARQYPRVILGVLFVLTGIVEAIPMMAYRSSFVYQVGATDRDLTLSAELTPRPDTPQTAILLNSPTTLSALEFLPTWRAAYDDLETRVFALQFARRKVTWTRTSADAMTLTAPDTPFLTNRFEHLYQTRSAPLRAGDTFETALFTATIRETDEAGVRTVEFKFKCDLDDPAYRFLVFQNDKFVRVAPPAVGKTMELPAPNAIHRFAP